MGIIGVFTGAVLLGMRMGGGTRGDIQAETATAPVCAEFHVLCLYRQRTADRNRTGMADETRVWTLRSKD